MNQLPQKFEKTNGNDVVGCRRARTQLIFLGLYFPSASDVSQIAVSSQSVR
jgi:hypothetical protein